MNRLKNRAGLQDAFEPEEKRVSDPAGNSDEAAENGREGGGEGTDEVAGDRVRGVDGDGRGGDRVRGVDGDGRGEAGQEAEEGDEPESTEETKRNISSGSNGRRPVVAGCKWAVATIRALGGSCSRRGRASKGEPLLPACRSVPPDAQRRLPVSLCGCGFDTTEALTKGLIVTAITIYVFF